jgi:hypothetical protein
MKITKANIKLKNNNLDSEEILIKIRNPDNMNLGRKKIIDEKITQKSMLWEFKEKKRN